VFYRQRYLVSRLFAGSMRRLSSNSALAAWQVFHEGAHVATNARA
jgi:hypothetical protein